MTEEMYEKLAQAVIDGEPEDAEELAQGALGELGRHPQQADHDDPERRARSARANRDRDAGNIAQANGRREGCRESLEVRNLARFVRVVHNGVVVHEDGEVTGHTHTAAFDDEGP